MANPNDTQIGGDHYKSKTIQPWDYISSNNLGFLEGNIVKYVTRWRDKNGLQDLEKARHYLDKLISLAVSATDGPADQWIETAGHDPKLHPSTYIEFEMRNGSKIRDLARNVYFGHRGNAGDIIRYRIIK